MIRRYFDTILKTTAPVKLPVSNISPNFIKITIYPNLLLRFSQLYLNQYLFRYKKKKELILI